MNSLIIKTIITIAAVIGCKVSPFDTLWYNVSIVVIMIMFVVLWYPIFKDLIKRR